MFADSFPNFEMYNKNTNPNFQKVNKTESFKTKTHHQEKKREKLMINYEDKKKKHIHLK